MPDSPPRPRPDGLPIWVVYDHPDDMPGMYVARLWIGEEPTRQTMASPSLETVRWALRMQGLTCLAREAGDDPVIVETWL